MATPAAATPAVPLHDAPRDVLSPPFLSADGRELTLADFRGKVVLLNVWTTWCVPCREEMPALDALQARLGGADFHVVAMSIDRAGLPAVKRFYAEIGLRNLHMYLAEDRRASLALGVIGLPMTILIDRQGRELGRLVGPAEWDSPAMIAFFETVMAGGRN